MNQPALPTSGTVTRDQYRQQFDQRMQAMRGGAPGATPGGPGGATMTMTFNGGANNSMTMTPGTPGQFPGGGGFGGGGGGFGRGGDPSQMTDEQIQGMMRRYDMDGDGKISRQEASRNDRLMQSFDLYDKNRDGYIDASEYRGYLADRMSNRGGPGGPGGWNGSQQGNWGNGNPNFSPMNSPGMDPSQQWGGGQPGGWGGNGFDPTSRGERGGRDQRNEESERPVVYRYGKLPKDLPGWFTSLDEDKDGQIGLWEWRKGGKPTAEFIAMDLNGDGLLTAEEYLRYRRQTEGDSKDASADDEGSGGGSRGNRSLGGGVDRGNSDRGSNDRGGRGGPRGRGGDSANSPEKDGSKSQDREDRRTKGGKGGNPFRSN
jgi:hypothetical protein